MDHPFEPGGPTRRRAAIAIGVIVLGVSAAAHVRVSSLGLSYAGPLLILSHLFDLAAVLGLLAICAAAGRAVLSAVDRTPDRPIEELLFGVALGMGIVATLVLALGMAGLIGPIPLAVFFGAFAAAAYRHLARLPSLLGAVGREVRRRSGDPVTLAVAVTVTSVVAAFLFTMAMAPPVDWDSQMYHLTVPREFLEHRRIFLPEDNLHTAFVGLIHMLYLPLLAAGSSAGPAILSAAVAVLTGLAVFSLAARLFGGSIPSLSLALVWGTTTILLVAITPRTDVTLTFLLLMAHFALLRANVEHASREETYYLLAALLLGLAFGAKYHAVPYGLALVPLILWIPFKRPPLMRGIRAVGVFALVGLIASLPWLLKNWYLLGSPVYPFLAADRIEPWLVPYLGTTVVPESLQWVLETITVARQRFDILAAFFDPGSITIEFEGVYHYLSPVLLATPLWLIYLRDRALNWLIIPPILYLLILIVPFSNTNLRYLIPAAVPLTIAVACVLHRLAERFLSRPMMRIVLLAVVALALISSSKAALTWLRLSQAPGHLIGSVSGHDYIASYPDPSVRTLTEARDALAERAGEGDRVLMLYESRKYYFDVPALQDTRASNWPFLASALEPGDCLERSGVTHVLLSTGAMRYYSRRGVDPKAFRWERFLEFADTCLGGEPVYEGAAFLLFERR